MTRVIPDALQSEVQAAVAYFRSDYNARVSLRQQIASFREEEVGRRYTDFLRQDPTEREASLRRLQSEVASEALPPDLVAKAEANQRAREQRLPAEVRLGKQLGEADMRWKFVAVAPGRYVSEPRIHVSISVGDLAKAWAGVTAVAQALGEAEGISKAEMQTIKAELAAVETAARANGIYQTTDVGLLPRGLQ